MKQYRKQDGTVYDGISIQLEGMTIINPTEEMLLRAGYEEYIPEVYVPVAEEPTAAEVLEAVKKHIRTDAISDGDAVKIAAVFPTWKSKIGRQVKTGERLWFNGCLYKVMQDHTVAEEHQPSVYTLALYNQVCTEDRGNKASDAIEFQYGMALVQGRYYKDDGVLYRCTMSLPNCTWDLKHLVKQYVETVENDPENGTVNPENGTEKPSGQNPDTSGEETVTKFITGMKLVKGRIYEQAGVKYRCTRDLPNCIHDLMYFVGQYVEKV